MRMDVQGLCVEYNRYRAVDDVSFDVGPGDVLGILGPNGSGKSTIIKSLAGVLKRSSGKVEIDGRDVDSIPLEEKAKLISYVPQSIQSQSYLTVLDTVLLGRKPHVKWKILPSDLKIVENAMDMISVRHMASKQMDQISGGERQKVLIARAFAQKPRMFLFDEPTSSLDLKHQLDVLEVTGSVARDNDVCVILAIHDLNLAYRFCNKVLLLKKGMTCAYGRSGEVLTPEVIKKVYDVDVSILEGTSGRYIVPERLARNTVEQ